MPQSLSKIYLHVIFSTKGRRELLKGEVRDELHRYLIVTLNELGCPAICVGGVADHVHLLFCLSRTITVSDLVKAVKTKSTAWMQHVKGKDFAWQTGYAVFSVSQSKVDAVKHYIGNQEEHHSHMTFQAEYRRFLQEYGVTFNETYVWD